MCSPGRWAIASKVLPNDYTSKELRKILRDGLVKCIAIMAKSDPKMDMKRLLMSLALGRFRGPPFDEKVIAEVRSDLRTVCKRSGHGDGLPLVGDVVQTFEVRLIQAMLSAFQDPDALSGP